MALVVSDVAGAIRRALQRIRYLAGRVEPEALRRQTVADVSWLRDEVGFAPAIDLERGLAETVAWWRELRNLR